MMMGFPGIQFEECWDRRAEVDFEGLEILFISKQDLIASKRTAGRSQDLLDVDLLLQG